MKCISREALDQILDAFITASQYRIEHYKDRDDILHCEGKIQAFEAVKRSLDSVVGIDDEKED